MVEFVTIKAEEMKFGDNKFIEVAKKKAMTEEGENVFISLSRGFFTPEGERRYRKSFSMPVDKAVVDFVAEKLADVFDAKEEGEEAAVEEAAVKEKKSKKKSKEVTEEVTEEAAEE